MSSRSSSGSLRAGDRTIVSHLIPRTALAAAVSALLLAPGALATGSASPNEIGLAKSLKAQMQSTYRKQAPGTTFTTVTCKISQDQTSARCAAQFTRKAQNLKGVYQVTVNADANGNAQWRATSATCRNLATGAKLKC